LTTDRPPSVDRLARSLADLRLPHPLLVDAARDAIRAGAPEKARGEAERRARSLLRPVINATGVLLHTNLGRAPRALDHGGEAWNLELDLETGRRGSRNAPVASLVARLVHAPAALVVNNGAAAVLLALTVVARGRPVVVSRGELVEIGGGFRIPEVLELSGAPLLEVGTTNRTDLADYRRALDENSAVGAILKVHPSNYTIVGFTKSVPVGDLAALGQPVVADLGSGLLDATTPWLPEGPPAWLRAEPAALQTLDAGATVVTFSGDKLLGGPQAGFIAGAAEVVDACAAHPLYRALRPGVHIVHALQDTLLAYLRRDAQAIPLWRMASSPTAELWCRAERIAGACGVPAVPCRSVLGGGSVPGAVIPSAGLAMEGDLGAVLRGHEPPVVARVEDGHTICDLRTVDPADDPELTAALVEAQRCRA
jgi:L-seryl-tRNA(Ser) seleniumtransferase